MMTGRLTAHRLLGATDKFHPIILHIHSLRPDHCYRAATADGSNAIFLISAHEENQLADAGGLGQEKQLVFMASKVVAGTVGR